MILDKMDLAKEISEEMTIHEQPELFLEWAARKSTTMKDVLKWASKEIIEKANKKYSTR